MNLFVIFVVSPPDTSDSVSLSVNHTSQLSQTQLFIFTCLSQQINKTDIVNNVCTLYSGRTCFITENCAFFEHVVINSTVAFMKQIWMKNMNNNLTVPVKTK